MNTCRFMDCCGVKALVTENKSELASDHSNGTSTIIIIIINIITPIEDVELKDFKNKLQ